MGILVVEHERWLPLFGPDLCFVSVTVSVTVSGLLDAERETRVGQRESRSYHLHSHVSVSKFRTRAFHPG